MNDFFGAATPLELIERFGSPLYVYNEDVLRARCRELRGLSAHPGFRVCYSSKANTNPAILSIIRSEGCLSDAMSPGEIALNVRAGYAAKDMVYVCNNVSADELAAAVDFGLPVSVDSLSQLEALGSVRPGAECLIRLNPGIGAGHHSKVITAGKATKFGIEPGDLPKAKELIDRTGLRLVGINQHIGSCFMETTEYLAACRVQLDLAERIAADFGTELEIIDFGGGFGIPYRKVAGEERLDLQELGRGFDALITRWADDHAYNGCFHIEPGRYVVAECGVLLGTVTAVKRNHDTRYAGTDIGFNHLMRPILYDAYHEVDVFTAGADRPTLVQTIVGNICESGDILAKDRMLSGMEVGDIIGVRDVGAYGYVMASSYNQRPRPAEVLVTSDGSVTLIRRRESIEDLMAMLV